VSALIARRYNYVRPFFINLPQLNPPQLDDLLSADECGLDGRPGGFQCLDQRLIAAIADSDPQQSSAVIRARGKREKIIVLAGNDSRLASGKRPNGAVIALPESEVQHMDCVVAFSGKPVRY